MGTTTLRDVADVGHLRGAAGHDRARARARDLARRPLQAAAHAVGTKAGGAAAGRGAFGRERVAAGEGIVGGASAGALPFELRAETPAPVDAARGSLLAREPEQRGLAGA